MLLSKFPTVTLISHTSSFINFLLIWKDDNNHQGMVRKCTASTYVQCLDELCKNHISEQGHVLRYWVLEFQHNSLHNTHPVLPISVLIHLLSLMVPAARNLKVIWAYRDLCTLKSGVRNFMSVRDAGIYGLEWVKRSSLRRLSYRDADRESQVPPLTTSLLQYPKDMVNLSCF